MPTEAELEFENIWQAFLEGVKPKELEDGVREHALKVFLPRVTELLDSNNPSGALANAQKCGKKAGIAAKGYVEQDAAGNDLPISTDIFDDACEDVRIAENSPFSGADVCN